MSLSSPMSRDIEQYVADGVFAPVYFPPFTTATKPVGVKFRYKGIYITDTSRPAWMDASGAWRYADGSAV